jgi:mono/diheme cytochrome c family protein
MMRPLHALAWSVVGLALLLPLAAAGEGPSPERGKHALFTRHFTAPSWTAGAYDELWKLWEPAPKKKPADYDAAVRAYYGLHPAPFPNGKYPLGLRETTSLFGKGVTSDCMLCHGGSILGTSYVGLGNSALDIHSLFEDLNKASGRIGKLPFTFTNTRGTSEAAAMAVFLLNHREPDLRVRIAGHGFVLRDDLCEDTPAWWLLKKKKTMYHTGTSDARSVRSIMQFMLSPTNPPSTFEREEKTFVDIRAYLLTLGAPKYPFDVDSQLAERGKGTFKKTCAKCHGTYGPDATYPNRVVPLDVIGTDPNRFAGIPRGVGELYNRSWLAQETGDGYKVTEPKGYQAPPLDGVWATAPYFHNGSAPTLYHVLNSKSRPRLFTRSFRTDAEAFDKDNVGWKIRELDHAPPPTAPAHARRMVYDTTQPGRSNAGHTFGDHLTDADRRAVIEYLKTL